MKKYFSSGLIILLPIILTIIIVNMLINFLTHPFLQPTKNLLEQFIFFHHPLFLFHHSLLITFSSKILILFILSGCIILIGLLGKLFLIDIFFQIGDSFLHQLPFVNKIYKACQEVVHSLFSASSKKFSQVVFAPFPNTHNLSLGLVANQTIELKNCGQKEEELISVFIPGTPNPSVGYILMFKREQLLFVNMKVDDAMKFIVSCGMIMPDFEIIQPCETYEKQLYNENHVLSSERQFSQDSPDLHKSPGSF